MENLILNVLKEVVSDNCEIIAMIDQCDGFGIAMGNFIFAFKHDGGSSSYEVSSVPMEGIGKTVRIIIERLVKEILNKHFSESIIFKDYCNFLIDDNVGDIYGL